MSTKTKWPRAEALAVGHELCGDLGMFCSRIEIAGSLRRGKQEVGDVEILYVSKTESRLGNGELFDFGMRELIHIADECIAKLVLQGVLAKRPNKDGHFTWGDKNKLAVHAASGIPVDLFSTTEENWWTSLVVRTGGLENNLALTRAANERGRSLLAYGCGVKQLSTGEVTRADSERAVFELCGVKYAEPEGRA